MADDLAADVARLQAELRAAHDREAAARAEAQALAEDLAAAEARETALAAVLDIVARAPHDLTTVLQAIVESAARICDATSALLQQLRPRDGQLSARAGAGPLWDHGVGRYGGADAFFERSSATAASRQTVGGRAFLERACVHVHDMAQATLDEYPAARAG